MRKATFKSNILQVLKDLDDKTKNYQESKKKALENLAQLAFQDSLEKKIVKGQYMHRDEYGNKILESPPGANIEGTTLAKETEKGFKIYKKKMLYVKGKIVSRTGDYENQIREIASSKGSRSTKNIKLVIDPNSIKVMMDRSWEGWKIEAGGRANRRKPLTRSFASVVRIWKKSKIGFEN